MAFDPFFGQAVGLNTKYRVLEDATKAADPADTDTYAGRPLVLGAAGLRSVASTDVAATESVYGLAKYHKNSFSDETSGGFGAFGSGQGTAVMKGICEVKANQFVDSSGTETIVATFDATFTVAGNLMKDIFVITDAGADLGKLTTDGVGKSNMAAFGKLTAVAADANSAAEVWLD